MHLFDPSGASFTINNPGPSMRVISGRQPYVAIQVSTPRPGSWKVEARASASNSQAARFHLLVGSENPNLVGALHASAPTYRQGQSVKLNLRMFAPLPVTNIKIKAALSGPRRLSASVPFRDDGQMGDDVPNDGTYTAVFQAPRTPGTYRVRALVQGRKGVANFADADDPGDTTRRRRVVPSFTRSLETAFTVSKS
jgi:hypothetical protein